MKYGFFIFILAFFLSMMAYIIFRGSQALSLTGFWKYFYIAGSVTLFFAFFAGMIFSHQMSLPIAKMITFAGNSFLIILIYLTLSFLATDILLLINRLFHFLKADVVSVRFWAMMVSLGIIFIAMAVGNYRFNHPKTVRLEIQSAKPTQHKEIKIVGVSDIHLGVSIDKKRLQQYVQMINAEKPDVVFIAGDLIDRSIESVIRQNMDEELRSIHAPMGVYAVFGNHEYFGELGVLAGVEDEVSHEHHTYTQPEEVVDFVTRTGVDSLAISIGTSHGANKFTPEQCKRDENGILIPPPLRFDILEEIEKQIPGFPIVLHGSSSVPQEYVEMINKYGGALKDSIGIPESELRHAAESAVCKVNIDSDGRLAMTAKIREVFATKPAEFDPRKYLGPARDELKKLYMHKTEKVLGSAGKA